MFTKQDFIESVANDIAICKHLHTKLTLDKLDYRPSPNQRSTAELLQYLTMCVLAPATALVKNDWSVVSGFQEASKSVTYENFCEKMDEQGSKVNDLIDPLTADDLNRDAPTPFGVTFRLGRGLIEIPLKSLSSYKLQLFVHAKATGAENMTTYNAWLGKDKPE